ncbi:MAG: ATP-binding protein [Mariprofundaceae bacterium]|nr:ATP-binding protein [Mariprofundaceae bacterium]
MTGFMRMLPLLMSIALWLVIFVLWPDHSFSETPLIAWVNITLLIILSAALLNYGVRLLRQQKERRAGSGLRAKLVIALVTMLLIPTSILQVAANQMVEKGMDVWFDVRVDTLLDQALNLAQGFYARVDSDLKQGLITVMNDDILLNHVAALPASYSLLNTHMAHLMQHEGWQSIQIFDLNERLIAHVQSEGLLSGLESEALEEEAKSTLTLGLVSTKLITRDNEEIAVGYAPLRVRQNIVAVLRAQVVLPPGVVKNARAVEADYRSYRELERNRQAIRSTFTHAMLIATLIVILAAGIVAVGFARRLTSPIGDLARALERVTEGDLTVSIPSAPEDELGSLVDSFNRMTLRMKQNVEALEQTQKELTGALDSSRQRQYVLETLLANLQTGVLLIDASGNIRLLNQSMRELLNLSAEWVPGRSISSLCGGRLQLVCQFYDELCQQEGENLQRELELVVDHNSLHILARGVKLSGAGSAGFSGYLMVLDDVSSLAEAQRHRAWSEVAQRLAHEIKNPLTPIKLAAERLQRRFRKTADDTAVFDSCTHAIITQVERLQRLIGDFSNLARLPKPKPETVHVRDLITDMAELYGAYSRVHVEQFAEDLLCYCDADQIRQVLINLMDNALAATEESLAPVHLSGGHSPNMVEFHVQDGGSGIPEDAAGHIFEAYFSTKESGSGLGLAIAYRITDEHNGNLMLLSNANPTHFCLRLPMEEHSMEQS